MDAFSLLHSAPNSTALRARLSMLCKGKTFGESLNVRELLVIQGAMEEFQEDFVADIAAINEDSIPPPLQTRAHTLTMCTYFDHVAM